MVVEPARLSEILHWWLSRPDYPHDTRNYYIYLASVDWKKQNNQE